MSVQAATQYLEDRKLIAYVIEEHSNTVNEGFVISHSPQVGETLDPGSIVNLVVSLGEEELSPITYQLTEIVQYTGAQNDSGENDSEDDDDIDTDEIEHPKLTATVDI